MALTARKSEKEAILALVEGQIEIGEEDRAEWLKFCGQVLVLSHSLLSAREQWLIEHQLIDGGPSVLIGWAGSEKDAQKASSALAGGTARAVKVFPLQDLVDAQRAEEDEYGRLFGDLGCAGCGHVEWVHGAWRIEKGVLKRATVPAAKRCHPNCACKEWRDPRGEALADQSDVGTPDG